MRAPFIRCGCLLVAAAGSGLLAQEEEVILGRPSNIQMAVEPEQTVTIPAGARLRERPGSSSPVIEIFESPVELPVLDQRGPWVQVRYGSWLGWIRTDGQASEDLLEVPYNPDRDRLDRALELLGQSLEPSRLGPFTLYTDVTDRELLARLSAVAQGVVGAYPDRFGLDPGPIAGEVVVLFSREQDYRLFEAVEPSIARADSQGYTSEGLSIFYTGQQQRGAIEAILIHELTHLLGRKAFSSRIPAWLDEGMAQDLAYCRVDETGHLRLGTLSSVETDLRALLETWNEPDHIDLAGLISLDWDTFIEPEGRAIRYAQSAFLIRYLLSDKKHAAGFRRYLSELADRELADSLSVFEEMGVEPGRIEADLYRYLSTQAKAHGIR